MASIGNTWEAFKAYIRGCYQSSISRARKDAAITIAEDGATAQALESQYVLSRNPIKYLDMQSGSDASQDDKS